MLSDRGKFPPWGLAGGQPARCAKYRLNPDTELVEHSSKTSIELSPGNTFSVQMGGGGGYGSPLERDPSLVLRDVLSGRITQARAQEVYGVVLDEAGDGVDEKRTFEEREKLSRD